VLAAASLHLLGDEPPVTFPDKHRGDDDGNGLEADEDELVEILQSDYIRTARAKGLSDTVIVFKHGLRNALLPVVTSLGLSFGSLFTGAIVTEAIFAWPGLGRLAYESITGLVVPVIVGTVIFGSFGILLGNLLSDVAYAVLDPRIRHE
jgi:peptide/nickel transport system permease protein